jgi:hypothetical protein
MSFFLTTDQVRNRTKTVTRRLGWKKAKPGDVVQPVVKGQGLKKGEHPEKIGGPIRFVKVTRERLIDMSDADCPLEGFPQMTAQLFVRMFVKHNGCDVLDEVTRIEFEYLP